MRKTKAIKELEGLESRIKQEYETLSVQFPGIDKNKQTIVNGLIQRAAFMRVSLEDLENDLNENGFTELFSQGDQEPYQRKRPSADLYNTMNANYQKIVRQLTDLLPKDLGLPKEAEDGFEEFVEGRES